MTGSEPLRDAVVLMLIGMGLVFLLLILLVFAIKLLGWLLSTTVPAGLPVPDVPQEVAVAIAMALHRHRQHQARPDDKEKG